MNSNNFAGLKANTTYVVTENSSDPKFDFMFNIFNNTDSSKQMKKGYEKIVFLAASTEPETTTSASLLEKLSSQLNLTTQDKAHKLISENNAIYGSSFSFYSIKNHDLEFDVTKKDPSTGESFGDGEILLKVNQLTLKDIKKQGNYWTAKISTSPSDSSYSGLTVRIYSLVVAEKLMK